MPLDVLQPAGFTLPDFLKRAIVWPRPGDGSFVSMHIGYKKGGKTFFPGTPCETERAVARFIERSYQRYDVYVCMSTQTKRKAGKDRTDRAIENAGLLRSLYLDIDVKPDTYPTEAIAVAETGRIIAAIGLPGPTFVLQSGSGGRHLHWVTEPMQPDRWQKLADSLANAFEKHGAKIDLNVGVDCSRILRVPGTFNFKTGTPRVVQMDPASTLQECSIVALEAILHPYYGSGRTRVSGHKRVIERPPSFVGVPLDPAFQQSSVASVIARSLPTVQDLATGCPWVAGLLATGGNGHHEPLWKEAMNVACHVQDGDIVAHQFSQGDPRYVPADTDAKYAQQKAVALGWPSCATIARAGAVECQTCPHRQVQGGSLFHFMRVVPNSRISAPVVALAGPAPSPPAGGLSLGAATVVLGLNGQPSSFGYDGSAGYVTRKNDKGVVKPICTYPLFGGRLVRYSATDIRLRFETTISQQRVEIEVPLAALRDSRATYSCLCEQSMSLTDDALILVRKFMSSWIETLSRDPANISVATPGFGWHGDGFVFDGTMYTPAGETPVLPTDPEISRAYSVTGERAPWTAAVEMVLARNNPGLNAILASTLGGPLVKFSAEDGLWLHAISPPGGSKTTANRVAVAFWGDKNSKIGQNDTNNSMQKKMETVRNITVFHDDLQVTADNAAEVSQFAMTITSGQGRGRLTQDAKQRAVGHWSTFYSSNGNVSVRDAFDEHSRKTAAAHTRVFEIAVPKPGPQGLLQMGDATQTINRVDTNYGHAGQVYAKYLGTNRAAVETMMTKTVNAVSTAYSCTSDERFWACTMAALLVGAALGRHLGLIPFTDADMTALRAYLGEALETNRRDTHTDHAEATPDAVDNHISDYLSDNLGAHGAIVSIGSQQPTPCTPGHPPVRLAIEVNRVSSMVWFDRAHFRDWMRKRQLGQRAILKQLAALGVREARRALFDDCNKGLPQSKVLGIAMDNPNFPGLPR